MEPNKLAKTARYEWNWSNDECLRAACELIKLVEDACRGLSKRCIICSGDKVLSDGRPCTSC
jgi:hypothetical protein